MNEPEEAVGKTVGEFVAEDYRIASVFEKHGIDFCCGGKIPLTSLCQEKNLDYAAILREVEEAKTAPIDRSRNYNAWELPFLADYIVNTHHAYVKESVSSIAGYTRKIAEVHGERHPELTRIAVIFNRIVADLLAHLREEEEVLFPAVRQVETARKENRTPDPAAVDLIRKTLDNLHQDHEEVGEALHMIRDLTKEYAVPEDGCNTYAVTYLKLKEFEDDLHKHVHLENNILFPKAGRP